MKSNLNEIILLSFQGNILGAIMQTDYQWLMFYPCLYMFAMWDAYKDSGGELAPFALLPFVGAAFLATVGLMYSNVFRIRGFMLGPVWLGMLMCFVGIGVGFGLKRLIIVTIRKNAE